jgi:hypothetical protein
MKMKRNKGARINQLFMELFKSRGAQGVTSEEAVEFVEEHDKQQLSITVGARFSDLVTKGNQTRMTGDTRLTKKGKKTPVYVLLPLLGEGGDPTEASQELAAWATKHGALRSSGKFQMVFEAIDRFGRTTLNGVGAQPHPSAE